ncbi:hypothetical protein ACWCPM_31350, partial [Streptomyces sp. NPDC002309]
GGTAGRRDGGTAGRRDGGTAGRRDGGTAGRRDGGIMMRTATPAPDQLRADGIGLAGHEPGEQP